jgi:hypothetical protein
MTQDLSVANSHLYSLGDQDLNGHCSEPGRPLKPQS